jgi:hypothetical protein
MSHWVVAVAVVMPVPTVRVVQVEAVLVPASADHQAAALRIQDQVVAAAAQMLLAVVEDLVLFTSLYPPVDTQE